MAFTSALNLTFSPGRRNSYSPILALRMVIRPIPSCKFSRRRRMILLLLGEKAGMREVVTPFQ
jgi:hypothetical protein